MDIHIIYLSLFIGFIVYTRIYNFPILKTFTFSYSSDINVRNKEWKWISSIIGSITAFLIYVILTCISLILPDWVYRNNISYNY